MKILSSNNDNLHMMTENKWLGSYNSFVLLFIRNHPEWQKQTKKLIQIAK